MKKRILAILLSLCLLVGLLSTAALATEDNSDDVLSPVCTCENLCIDGTLNTDCQVCAEGITDCKGKSPADEEEPDGDPTGLELSQEEGGPQENGDDNPSGNEDAELTRAVLAEKIYTKFQDSIGEGAESTFLDIDACNNDQQKAINALAAAGIVSGTSANTFNPTGTVTRAEAVVVLWRALGCKSNPTAVEQSPYTDVNGTEPYGPAVFALTAMGIISGNGDGAFFGPTEKCTVRMLSKLLERCTNDTENEVGSWEEGVTRLDMLMEVYEEYKDNPVIKAKADIGTDKEYADIADCSEVEKAAISFFTKAGIISGLNTEPPMFQPYAPASNFQIAMLLKRCAEASEPEAAAAQDIELLLMSCFCLMSCFWQMTTLTLRIRSKPWLLKRSSSSQPKE